MEVDPKPVKYQNNNRIFLTNKIYLLKKFVTKMQLHKMQNANVLFFLILIIVFIWFILDERRPDRRDDERRGDRKEEDRRVERKDDDRKGDRKERDRPPPKREEKPRDKPPRYVILFHWSFRKYFTSSLFIIKMHLCRI